MSFVSGIRIRNRLRKIVACFCIIAGTSLPLHAQWSLLAPNLLGPQNTEMGAITHKSGLCWAGSLNQVFMSPDSGISWTKRTPAIGATDYVNNITFYDNKTGLVSTNDGNIFRTDDQGLTWKEIHKSRISYNNGALSTAFLGTTDNIIVAGGNGGGSIEATHDGGLTWKLTWQTVGSSTPQVNPLLGGSALALAGTKATGLFVLKTTDYGDTWVQMASPIGFDSYSFAVNPCDPSIIYAAHEEGSVHTLYQSQILVSSDGGNSWTITQSFPIDKIKNTLYFSGSIALTTKAVFVQTIAAGVHRSTDKGTTWQAIGGPSATWDTRLVCAINSNIVLAADNAGSIWRTLNSGGDSLTGITPYESLALNPNRLFSTDSLISCDSPAVETVHLHGVLCNPVKIIGQHIGSGIDSADYKIILPIGDSLTGDDSVKLSFLPHGSGPQTGEYIIVLADSTLIIVPLDGYGKNIRFVEPRTSDFFVDTIGGFAKIPIRFNGFTNKEDLEVILHYDSRLIYNNSISLTGAVLDEPGSRWSGRSKLVIPKAELETDTITGYAIFTVFPQNNDCFKVSLDSMSITSAAKCSYSIGNSDTATICTITGCGIMDITNFMLHGTLPQLFIQPNPSHGSVSITSSENLGETTIEISDMLGRIIGKQTLTIRKSYPVSLALPLNDGIYNLHLRTPFSVYNLRAVVSR
jgi:photosystem II stability/assembly factor-like uncharacterized protein